MIMLGWVTLDDLKKEYLDAPIPHEYDPLHLPSIISEQIVWYDEMHIKQEGGTNTNDGYQVRFHRDENGKYSPSSPRLAPNNMKATFKYPEQTRFCLGVCKVKLENGSFEGRKCRVFDFTCKKIISIEDYEKKKQQEIFRVKSLKSDKATSPWIKRTRPDGCDDRYQDEDINMLNRVGEKAISISKKYNITKIGELKNSPPEVREGLAKDTLRGLDGILLRADASLDIDNPFHDIDYRQANNPYLARFEEDGWEDAISSSSAMSPLVSIQSLVTYIITESSSIIKGAAHKDDWYLYHDALALMTANVTMERMEKTMVDGKSMKSRWLVPQNGVNAHTVYEGRPVGNSPKFMPLDSSLNNDIKVSLNRH